MNRLQQKELREIQLDVDQVSQATRHRRVNFSDHAMLFKYQLSVIDIFLFRNLYTQPWLMKDCSVIEKPTWPAALQLIAVLTAELMKLKSHNTIIPILPMAVLHTILHLSFLEYLA